MPTAPLRPCAEAHCPVLVVKGRCAQHARPAWGSASPAQRTRGRKLRRWRKRLFSAQPLCVVCLKQGRTAEATIRDHVINLKAGGTDTEDNVQGLCEGCHTRKTQEESLRGRYR